MTQTQTMEMDYITTTKWNLAYTSDLLNFSSSVRAQFISNTFYNDAFIGTVANILKSKYPNTALVFCQEDGELFIHFHDEIWDNSDEVMESIINEAFKLAYKKHHMEVAQSLGNADMVEKFYIRLDFNKNMFYSLKRLSNISFVIQF